MRAKLKNSMKDSLFEISMQEFLHITERERERERERVSLVREILRKAVSLQITIV